METFHNTIDFIAHVNNVASLLHLNAQQQALLTVVLDVAVRSGILPAHVGNIFQAYVVAPRVGVYYGFHDVVNRIE